jgi:hypothetical protein
VYSICSTFRARRMVLESCKGSACRSRAVFVEGLNQLAMHYQGLMYGNVFVMNLVSKRDC